MADGAGKTIPTQLTPGRLLVDFSTRPQKGAKGLGVIVILPARQLLKIEGGQLQAWLGWNLWSGRRGDLATTSKE